MLKINLPSALHDLTARSTFNVAALAAFVLLIRFKVQPWIVVLGVSLASILVELR